MENSPWFRRTPCFEHRPAVRVDLYIPKGEDIVRRRGHFNNFRSPSPERIHDGLEHTAVRVSGPDDDNLFHRMLIPLYAKRERPQARPLSFAVLKIFAQTPL